MVLQTPATRMAAGALLLLTLLLPHAHAQVPTLPSDPNSQAYGFAVSCAPAFVEVAYLGAGDFACVVQDISLDSIAPPNGPRQGAVAVTFHSVTLELVGVSPADAQGWQLLIGLPFVPTYAGAQVPVPISVKTTPQLNVPQVTFDILATFAGSNGYTATQNLTLTAQVKRYDFAFAEVVGKIKRAGQDENVEYVVQITNLGVYPDVYEFGIRSQDPGFQVTVPAGVYVPPLSTRNVTIGVMTPNDAAYELGRNTLVFVTVRSTTGVGVYTTTGILQMSGPYLPPHWVPLFLVGLVSAIVVTRGARERAELRRLEKGRPRRVEPTPRQAILLSELKRKDPEAYKARREALDAIYAQRRETYLAAYKERKAADAEEARQAKAEFKAASRKRKADEKARRTQEKRDAKERKILERKESKLRRKKEKELAKRRKVLEKAKAKLDKKQARIDAKQAKADAKAQAKADKAAAKQAKAEAKAAKRRGGNP
jgi:hypothetical protein